MRADHTKFAYKLALRWFVCTLGIWIASGLFQGNVTYGSSLGAVIIAGLVLALINVIIKPILVFLSIPALLLTVGLFMIVINGLTVLLASKLYAPLDVSGFWAAMGTGLVIGLVNYLVTAILEERR